MSITKHLLATALLLTLSIPSINASYIEEPIEQLDRIAKMGQIVGLGEGKPVYLRVVKRSDNYGLFLSYDEFPENTPVLGRTVEACLYRLDQIKDNSERKLDISIKDELVLKTFKFRFKKNGDLERVVARNWLLNALPNNAVEGDFTVQINPDDYEPEFLETLPQLDALSQMGTLVGYDDGQEVYLTIKRWENSVIGGQGEMKIVYDIVFSKDKNPSNESYENERAIHGSIERTRFVLKNRPDKLVVQSRHIRFLTDYYKRFTFSFDEDGELESLKARMVKVGLPGKAIRASFGKEREREVFNQLHGE